MKKEKKVKRKLRVKLLLFILLVMYLIAMVIYQIFTININDIIINGNNHLSDLEILEIIEINNDTNSLSVSKSKIKNTLEENSYIKSVEVKKTLLGDLTITIVENKVLFINQTTSKVVLEGNNNIDITNNQLGVPTLINYTPDKLYEELIEKLAMIDQTLINKISEIEYAPNIKEGVVLDEERFVFKMNDSNTVHVNLVNFEKFEKYNDIMEIQKEKGTLYLDSSNSGHIFEIYGVKEEVEDELPE